MGFVRLALVAAVLALAVPTQFEIGPGAAPAMAQSGGKDRGERGGGRSERSDTGGGKAEGRSGAGKSDRARAERSGARAETSARAERGRNGRASETSAGAEASEPTEPGSSTGDDAGGGAPDASGDGGDGGTDGGTDGGDGGDGGSDSPDTAGPDTGGGAPETPTVVDSPTPAPSAPAPAEPAPAPVRVDDPAPAPSRPADGDPTPSLPPSAKPAAPDPTPDVPVRVDAPTPAPEAPAPASPPPAAPAPVVVDGPTPTPTPTSSESTPPAGTADGTGQPVAGGGGDGGAASGPARPTRASSDAGGASLPEVVRRIFGGRRARAPEPQAPAQPAPVVEVAPDLQPAPEVGPAPEPAAQARVPEPPQAARAPRIELSSGGGRETYRQYEISALGLTPRARQVIGALGFRILSERRSPLLGNRIVARLRTPRNETAEVAIQRARQVLPELTFDFAHLYRPSGERTPVRYPAEMIGATPVGACRIEARIGLIDSGVGAHPSLARASVTRRNFVARDAATNVAHGTAVASILVGDLPGSGPLAPGAQIFSANVFAQDANGLRADAHAIIEALDWLAEQRVRVVNLSLMGPANALLDEAVRAAAGRGQVLVAAAGNDGPAAGPAYPAAYPAVIAVAAVDARGRPYGRNNRGAYVEVTAPGVDIWGADARGGEAFWTGTSFAAPFVTATVARDMAQGRARNINDGRARLAAGARDLGAPGRDPVFGHGLLQVGGCGGSGGSGGSVLSSRD